MKKVVMILFGFCWVFGAWAQEPGFRLEGISSAVIPVTVDKMTNLVFPDAVQAGVKVSAAVIVQKVRGVENVIEIKALRRDFTATNLSVYGRDGRLYSFVLHYVADDSVLNFRVVAVGIGSVMLTGLPAGADVLRQAAYGLEGKKASLRVSAQAERVMVGLCGVHGADSLEWVVLRVRNRSGLDFVVAGVRYYVEERKRVARRAVQEAAIMPVFTDAPAAIRVSGEVRFAAGFEPFFVGKGRRLVCEIRAKDGRVVRVLLDKVRCGA
jgi:uncharacterized protein (UPF0254 family)